MIAQCKAGIVGSFPALNARPQTLLDEWLHRITEELAAWDRDHPDTPAAPVRGQPDRPQVQRPADDRTWRPAQKWKVPIVITSLGASEEVNDGVHAWGGITLHDIIHDRFARKAVEKGADGLIAVAAGAGGHAGTLSPFALVQEIREWFDGPLAAVRRDRHRPRGARRPGDGRRPRLYRLALHRDARGQCDRRLQAGHRRGPRLRHRLFEPLHRRARQLSAPVDRGGRAWTRDNLPEGDLKTMDFGGGEGAKKAWRDIWGSGQGIGAVTEVLAAGDYVAKLTAEYQRAKAELMAAAL